MMESMATPEAREHTKKRIRGLFTILGRTHTLSIISHFVHQGPGRWRFNELRDALDLPPNTLSRRLKEMEAVGFLTRHAINEVPPRVEYEATEATLAMCGVMGALHTWVDDHADILLE